MSERRHFVASLVSLLTLGGCVVMKEGESTEVRVSDDLSVRLIPNKQTGGLTIVLKGGPKEQPFHTEIEVKPRPDSDPLISDPLVDVKDLAFPSLPKEKNYNDPEFGLTTTRVRIPIGTRIGGPTLGRRKYAHAHSGHARRVVVEC